MTLSFEVTRRMSSRRSVEDDGHSFENELDSVQPNLKDGGHSHDGKEKPAMPLASMGDSNGNQIQPTADGPKSSSTRRDSYKCSLSVWTNKVLKADNENNVVVAKKGRNGLFSEEKVGSTTILQNYCAPFVQKTHAMITYSDESIAHWTADGNMFFIKNIEAFEKKVIPQYFNHSQFSSFVRQLNFYGFRKIQPIRISDCDQSTVNYVTFYNENFKRDRTDLLCNIRRRKKRKGSPKSGKDTVVKDEDGDTILIERFDDNKKDCINSVGSSNGKEVSSSENSKGDSHVYLPSEVSNSNLGQGVLPNRSSLPFPAPGPLSAPPPNTVDSVKVEQPPLYTDNNVVNNASPFLKVLSDIASQQLEDRGKSDTNGIYNLKSYRHRPDPITSSVVEDSVLQKGKIDGHSYLKDQTNSSRGDGAGETQLHFEQLKQKNMPQQNYDATNQLKRSVSDTDSKNNTSGESKRYKTEDNETKTLLANEGSAVISEEKVGSKAVLHNDCAAFVQKTHNMITFCDEKIAQWTTDGNMFFIKNIEAFEKEIIPQFFDHSQYSSFARQLNFYGFRKVQRIQISDSNQGTVNYVTFYNENFKRDRTDLLCNIRRRTKGAAERTQRHIEELAATVSRLTDKVDLLDNQNIGLRERISTLEQILLNRQI